MTKTKDNFLPDNYEVKETPSNYSRFQDGDNRFRILGSAVIGYEYFNIENKPVRSKELFESTPDLKKNGKVKVFWAMPVWSYNLKMIQILEITQVTIMRDIKGFIDNPKWGDIFKYDINIKRTGEGMETKYQTQAEPPIGEPSEEIANAFMDKPMDLEKLFTNEDPFAN